MVAMALSYVLLPPLPVSSSAVLCNVFSSLSCASVLHLEAVASSQLYYSAEDLAF